MCVAWCNVPPTADARGKLPATCVYNGIASIAHQDAAAAALEFFVECEIDHFGDENHCKAFALERDARDARARRRAAARAGLGDDAATLRPISAASYAAMAYPAPREPPKPQFCRPCTTPALRASLPRTCSSSSP